MKKLAISKVENSLRNNARQLSILMKSTYTIENSSSDSEDNFPLNQ